MFEFILIIGAAIAMGRFAESDRQEGLKWGAITFGLCLASLLLPIPFLRVMIACAVSLGLMTFGKKTFY